MLMGRDSWGVWEGHVQVMLYSKWITSKDLLCTQCYVQAGWEGSLGENEYMNPFTADLKLRQHCESVRCCAMLSRSVMSDSL